VSIGNAFGSHEGYLKVIGNTDNKGLFGFAKLDNPKNFMADTDVTRRCDFDQPLALRGFHRWENGSCNCGLTDVPSTISGGHFDLEALTALFVVVDASPAGLICYFEFANEEDFYLTQRGNTLTRTLQEQFRFLLEWKYAHEHLDNNEEIAITATEMVNLLEIPQSIHDWIISEVPNEKVNRFLEGRTDALQRTQNQIPDLTDEFKVWLLDRFKIAKGFGEHR
jgi:hypothetical protein